MAHLGIRILFASAGERTREGAVIELSIEITQFKVATEVMLVLPKPTEAQQCTQPIAADQEIRRNIANREGSSQQS